MEKKKTNQFIGFNPSILVAQILSGRELAAVSALTTSRSAPLCPPCFQYVMVRPKLGPEDARTARNGLQKQTPSPVQSTQKFFSGRRASADPPSDLVLIRNLLASVAAAASKLAPTCLLRGSGGLVWRSPGPAIVTATEGRFFKSAPASGCFGDSRRRSLLLQ